MKISQNAPGQIFGQRSTADVAKSTAEVVQSAGTGRQATGTSMGTGNRRGSAGRIGGLTRC